MDGFDGVLPLQIFREQDHGVPVAQESKHCELPAQVLHGIVRGQLRRRGLGQSGAGKQGKGFVPGGAFFAPGGKAPQKGGPVGPAGGKPVRCAAVNQGPGFGFIQPDALQKIEHAGKPGFLPLPDNPVHGFRRQPPDRGQPHAHGAVGAFPAEAAVFHVRGENRDPHAPCLGHVGKGGIKSPLVADDRGHKRGRKMRFQVGGFKGNFRVRGAVGLAEGIPVKAHDHAPDRFDLPAVEAAQTRAAGEPVEIVAQATLSVFFGHHFSEAVRIGRGKPRHGNSHPGYVFLKNHQAEGAGQNVLQDRMDRRPPSPVQAADVLADDVVCRRADNGGMNHQVLEIPDSGFLLQQAHGRAFNVKTAHGISPGDGLLRGPVLLRRPGRLIHSDPGLPNARNGIADHS